MENCTQVDAFSFFNKEMKSLEADIFHHFNEPEFWIHGTENLKMLIKKMCKITGMKSPDIKTSELIQTEHLTGQNLKIVEEILNDEYIIIERFEYYNRLKILHDKYVLPVWDEFGALLDIFKNIISLSYPVNEHQLENISDDIINLDLNKITKKQVENIVKYHSI